MGACSIIAARVRIGTYNEGRDVMDELAKRDYSDRTKDERVCRYGLSREVIDSENFGHLTN